ncbi:ABC transporter permease [Aliikangiella maris]|uniref:FtsX-like permease family protein n=2 Tax=Aliikangiella maris TaxID=3162458 RepID=A0ABV2BU99_9GAMM
MNTLLKIGLRNLFRNKQRSLQLGLLIAFSAFIISFFSQFLAGIVKNFSGTVIELATGDIYLASHLNDDDEKNIFDRDYEYFSLDPAIKQKLATMDEVKYLHPRLEVLAQVSTHNDTVSQQLLAYDLSVEKKLNNNFNFIQGRMLQAGKKEIILPKDFAERYQVKVDDSLAVLAKTTKGRINVIRLKVVGIFTISNLSIWFENYLYTDIGSAQIIANDPNVATRINIGLKENTNIEQFIEKVAPLIEEVKTPTKKSVEFTNWQVGAENFKIQIQMFETSFFVLIMIVCLVLAAAITFTTILVTMERTKEIATYGGLGARPKKIRRILVTENVILSNIFSITGILLAIIIYLITQQVGIPVTSEYVASIIGSSRFYPALDIEGFVGSFILTWLVAFIASYFVTRSATKKPIADAMADR